MEPKNKDKNKSVCVQMGGALDVKEEEERETGHLPER